MIDEHVYRSLVEIAANYGIFECEVCANAMQRWLIRHKRKGIRLMLRTYSNDFMISNRVGGHMSITQNGCHYGIEVSGYVFDNLPQTGITKQAWLNDFESIDDILIEEMPF